MSAATLIYDGECSVCAHAVTWIRDRAGDRIEVLPCQDARREKEFPQISSAQCMESMWLVMADGTHYAADRALPPLLRLLPRWRLIAWVCELPVIRHIAPHVYRTIAQNRYALSALIAKKDVEPGGSACGIDSDCSVPTEKP